MAKKEMTTFCKQTLMKQFKEYQKKPHDQISIGLHNDDLSIWEICFFNIGEGPLAEGFYKALLKFPYDFPNNPPEMTFQTEMWHPNIYPDGKVCISILHPPGEDEFNQQESADERWRPIISVEAILISVLNLLLDENPNLNSPANIDASKQFKENHAEYVKKVKRLARQSAETAFQ